MDTSLRLFFLSDDFYEQSNGVMSSYYSIKERTKYDLGFVETSLRRGYEVHIRPANKNEELWARRRLAKIKEASALTECASCKTPIVG